jgi:hypothetical protein
MAGAFLAEGGIPGLALNLWIECRVPKNSASHPKIPISQGSIESIGMYESAATVKLIS